MVRYQLRRLPPLSISSAAPSPSATAPGTTMAT